MSSSLGQEHSVPSISYNLTKTEVVKLPENPESISLELALKILELGDFEERWAIAKVLVKYGDLVIPALKEIVLDESAESEYRWYALKILSELQNPKIILIVSQLLEFTEDEDLISLGSQTLASQGKQSISLLSELLTSSEHRLFATKALAQIPNSNIITPLLSVVDDSNSEIRVTAIAALSNFVHAQPEIISVLINGLQDRASVVRKEAVNGLAQTLQKESNLDLVKLISPLLSDISLDVCQQAALSLSRLKTDSATEALAKVLQSPNTPLPLQNKLVRALAWIDSSLSIDYLARCLYSGNLTTTAEILVVFSRMSGSSQKSDIIATMLDFYRTNHVMVQKPQILQALCYAWAQLKAVQAREVITQIAKHDNNQVRFHAQSALTRLT